MNALTLTVAAAVAALVPSVVPATDTTWPQWGGPKRNFVTDSPNLALAWPADGPRRIWQRPLGDGFSAIVSDGPSLYTLYRDGENDVAIALDARTGKTIWEARYAAPFNELCSQKYGPIPRAGRSSPVTG